MLDVAGVIDAVVAGIVEAGLFVAFEQYLDANPFNSDNPAVAAFNSADVAFAQGETMRAVDAVEGVDRPNMEFSPLLESE